MTLAFTAYGKPEPQGSARAFMVKSLGRPVVTSDNPRNKDWRRTVAFAALEALRAAGLPQPLFPAGPVRLVLAFRLPRPKALKGTDVVHTTRPDVDKLVRSVCDALTGIAWGDDGQVVALDVRKGYSNPGEQAGVRANIQRPAALGAVGESRR